MSKEYLEALRTIKIKCHPNSNPSPLVDEALDTVEKALQRLELIDSAVSSEASNEALERLKDMLIGNGINDYINDYVANLILTIRASLLKAQEQEVENARSKQLEVELGCPLDVLFRALKEGIYLFEKFEHPVLILNEDNFKENNLSLLVVGTIVYLKDYKKTWWLKKDQSE